MKKIAIILLITILTAIGCTRIPASEETGVVPGEYEGSNTLSTYELKSENKRLNSKLQETLKELKTLKDDYLSIAKNNDSIIKKLEDSESLLKEYKDEGLKLPKFTVEKTDKNNITKYIIERKSTLSSNYRTIEMIPLKENENKIVFCTVGYGDNYNQIFIWEIGKNKPTMIEGASFNKEGNWKWLLQDKYIIIDSGKTPVSQKKIVDIDEMKLINTFEINSDNIYLIPGTASLLMQRVKTDTLSQAFIIFDFIINEEKELDFEFKDKNLQFKVDNQNRTIIYTGAYLNEDDIEYSVKVVMNIDKLKEKYSIKTLEESKEQKNPIDIQTEQVIKDGGNI